MCLHILWEKVKGWQQSNSMLTAATLMQEYASAIILTRIIMQLKPPNSLLFDNSGAARGNSVAAQRFEFGCRCLHCNAIMHGITTAQSCGSSATASAA